jgi:hypothetical protein
MGVHQELASKILSCGLIGILLGVGFVVLLISVRKENHRGETLKGVSISFLVVVTLSALVPLLTARLQYHVW